MPYSENVGLFNNVGSTINPMAMTNGTVTSLSGNTGTVVTTPSGTQDIRFAVMPAVIFSGTIPVTFGTGSVTVISTSTVTISASQTSTIPVTFGTGTVTIAASQTSTIPVSFGTGTIIFSSTSGTVNFPTTSTVNAVLVNTGTVTIVSTSTVIFSSTSGTVNINPFTTSTVGISPSGTQGISIQAFPFTSGTVNLPNTSSVTFVNNSGTVQLGGLGAYSYAFMSSNTSTTVKTSSGLLHSVVISLAGSGGNTLTLLDGGVTGSTISVLDTTLAKNPVYDIRFTSSLTAVMATGTAANATFSYL